MRFIDKIKIYRRERRSILINKADIYKAKSELSSCIDREKELRVEGSRLRKLLDEMKSDIEKIKMRRGRIRKALEVLQDPNNWMRHPRKGWVWVGLHPNPAKLARDCMGEK